MTGPVVPRRLAPVGSPPSARPLLLLLLALALASPGCTEEGGALPDLGILTDQAIAVADAPAGCSPTDPRSAPLQLGVQPDEGEKAYVDIIARARKSLRVFAYLMGTGGVLDGLKTQAVKGLDVRVILDVGNQSVNTKYQKDLVAAGAQAIWSDSAFANMHAKVIVGDDQEALISTGNFALSYMKTERNFTARTSDPKDVATLTALFDADWRRQAPNLSCTRLLVAPTNSRPRLLDLINQAKSSLAIESMQFADTDIRSAVAARQKAGVEVRVLIAAASWVDANADAATFLKGAGIPVRWLDSPAVHTKDIIVDGKVAYLGSINLSNTSISKNREVGTIVTEAANVQRMLSTFEKDWAAATPF